jgi:RES domain-containing protein
MPPTWAAIPAGRASAKFGSDWITSLRSAVLMVPSVIVPEESVSLINPAHPDASKIAAKVVRLFEYNRLFRS